jgi:hypothetical protein
MFETGTNGRSTQLKGRRWLTDASGGSNIVADVLNAASLLARIVINVVFWRFLPKENNPSTFSSRKASGIHSV